MTAGAKFVVLPILPDAPYLMGGYASLLFATLPSSIKSSAMVFYTLLKHPCVTPPVTMVNDEGLPPVIFDLSPNESAGFRSLVQINGHLSVYRCAHSQSGISVEE